VRGRRGTALDAGLREDGVVQGLEGQPGFALDKWKVKGEFNLSTGVTLDPDSEVVKVILNQAGPAPLYEATLPIASFIQKSSKPTWRFSDKEGDVVGAVGLRKVQAKRLLNKLTYSIDGRKVVIPVDYDALGAPPVRIRQTLRIGDDCATTVLRCAVGSNACLKCTSAP
jgi:hypothetical protein